MELFALQCPVERKEILMMISVGRYRQHSSSKALFCFLFPFCLPFRQQRPWQLSGRCLASMDALAKQAFDEISLAGEEGILDLPWRLQHLLEIWMPRDD